MGVRETGGKATGAQVCQETGGKGEMLMRERDPDNSLPPSDKAAGQTVMEGIHRKSYSEAVIEGSYSTAGSKNSRAIHFARTLKQDCGATIKVSLSEHYQSLVVKEVNVDHNHSVSSAAYMNLPRQRKLVSLYAEGSRTCYAVEPQQETTSKGVADYHRQKDNLLGIFYQDTTVRKAYASFSELLFIDATHKLTNLRMPLYVFLVLKGNGQSEIVATCLVSSEQRTVIDKMLAIFKSHNPSWKSTKIVLTDKDMKEVMAMGDFFRELRTIIACLRIERDSVALNCISKSWESQSVALETQSIAPHTRRVVPNTRRVAPETRRVVPDIRRVVPETLRVALAPPPEIRTRDQECCATDPECRA
ncbi:hypothetical protein LSAT2_026066 [Lamellibrachia satsuma]|nr:hypothetical protein LSAT2_026066 [Lamellibrachia satsuma]